MLIPGQSFWVVSQKFHSAIRGGDLEASSGLVVSTVTLSG